MALRPLAGSIGLHGADCQEKQVKVAAERRLTQVGVGNAHAPRYQNAAHRPRGNDKGLLAERCRSGRSGRSRKPLYPCGYRGFESHPLRHPNLSLETVAKSVSYGKGGFAMVHQWSTNYGPPILPLPISCPVLLRPRAPFPPPLCAGPCAKVGGGGGVSALASPSCILLPVRHEGASLMSPAKMMRRRGSDPP